MLETFNVLAPSAMRLRPLSPEVNQTAPDRTFPIFSR